MKVIVDRPGCKTSTNMAFEEDKVVLSRILEGKIATIRLEKSCTKLEKALELPDEYFKLFSEENNP